MTTPTQILNEMIENRKYKRENYGAGTEELAEEMILEEALSRIERECGIRKYTYSMYCDYHHNDAEYEKYFGKRNYPFDIYDWEKMMIIKEKKCTNSINNWIPVSERLPEDGTMCAIYCNKVTMGMYTMGQFASYGSIVHPSHWININPPLPPNQ